MPARTISSSNLSEASSSLSARGKRVPFSKSDIQIHITNHFKTKTYTTGGQISGSVTITTHREVRFDSVEIILLGGSKTRTEGYSAPHESTHTFLKLIMPIPESLYPVPRVLEAGRTVTIPFNFVLPTFLTLSACHHKIDADHVREQHLRLPPSMGGFTRSNSEKDDLGPHMAEVLYSIKARVWREPELRGRAVKIMEAAQPIQVMPASTEDAPLTIGPADTLYTMSKTKTLRKNILASKLGALTVSAHQPRAISLLPDGRPAPSTTTSVAQLDLHFAPLGDTSDARQQQPPRVAAVATKIVAHTFFAAGPVHNLPGTGNPLQAAGIAERRGLYTTSVALPTTTAAAADGGGQIQQPVWAMHRLSRCDSGYGSDTAPGSDDEQQQVPRPRPEPPRRRKSSFANLMRRGASPSPSLRDNNNSSSAAQQVQVVHTASLCIPLRLPTARRTFVPTFHSCILSRVYTLHVALTVESGGSGGGPTSKVVLDLPVQVVVSGDDGEEGGQEVLPSWAEAVEEAAAVDVFLRPRVLGVLDGAEGCVERDLRGALPGYERRI